MPGSKYKIVRKCPICGLTIFTLVYFANDPSMVEVLIESCLV